MLAEASIFVRYLLLETKIENNPLSMTTLALSVRLFWIHCIRECSARAFAYRTNLLPDRNFELSSTTAVGTHSQCLSSAQTVSDHVLLAFTLSTSNRLINHRSFLQIYIKISEACPPKFLDDKTITISCIYYTLFYIINQTYEQSQN